MDANPLIQTELTRIEDEARRQTTLFLAAQEAFVAAHALVDRLKQYGATEDLHVTPMYCLDKASMLIYPGRDSAMTVAAIQAAGLEISEVRCGYKDDVSQLLLRGYETVEVYVSRGALDWRAAA